LDAGVCKGHEGTVGLLLKRGWTNESPDGFQRALFLAVQGGWLRIAQMLIGHGAEFDSDVQSKTCHLIGAVKYGQPDLLKLLLDTKGAGWTADSDVCKQAYSLAVYRGYTTIIDHFVGNGLALKEV
jgi:hypothetical protein